MELQHLFSQTSQSSAHFSPSSEPFRLIILFNKTAVSLLTCRTWKLLIFLEASVFKEHGKIKRTL